MKNLLKLLILVVILGIFPFEMVAWKGMPTPPLTVKGNKLIDPTGRTVNLHGWFQPTSGWFNGQCYSDPSDWTNKNNVAGMLNFLNGAADIMSDTNPKYGFDHGWYSSFVRVNTDAIGGWTGAAGLVNTVQFDAWISNFLVPYTNYLKTRGIYLVLCATGPVCVNMEDDGGKNASTGTQSRLLTFWERIANAPGIKNADNIMFELMNEPVNIESSPGNGDWGMSSAKYFIAFRNWIQPVIDRIRGTGANNIIWVPTLEWQGSPQQHAQYPFTGTNCGVAAHFYPAYGGCHDNATCVQNLWTSQYKPAADLWPMIITEMGWDYANDGGLGDGSTSVWGNIAKSVIDKQGNVSYNIGFLDGNITLTNCLKNSNLLTTNDGAVAAFKWWPTYTYCAPDDGSPKFIDASVINNNPKQIHLLLSHAVNEVNNFDGFTVKIDNQVVGIDSIAIGDSTNQLVINLNNNISKENDIVLSYSNGNVVSIFGKNLVSFSDTLVVNLLKGASPRLIGLRTNVNGDTLIATFNMKMKLPSDISNLSLDVDYNGDSKISLLQSSFFKNDSSSLIFTLADRVYADYKLLLSYSGNSITSSDSGLLKSISDFPVTNNSTGLPVHLISGETGTDGSTIILKFSKPMEFIKKQLGQFTITGNGKSVTLKDFLVLNVDISFTLSGNLRFGDTVLISYTPGDVTAEDKGSLDGFSNLILTNKTKEPSWVSIPRKIEAENYFLQFGTSNEDTGDVGGGQDVGWIDNGEWLEYAIVNNTTDTNFEITFRVASPSANGRIDYYLNNIKAGDILIPNTGGYQTWRSIVDNITIGKGKQYLTLVTTKGGFNLNYFDIKKIVTGIRRVNDDLLTIYPNPVSNEMIIRSGDFQYNKVEIIDIMGKTVISRLTAYEPELVIPVNLLNGMYIVKISNEKQFQLKKILINNN